MTASTPQPPIDIQTLEKLLDERANLERRYSEMAAARQSLSDIAVQLDGNARQIANHVAETGLLTRLAAVTTERDEAVAMAWDEGFDAGERDVLEHESSGEWAHECIPNPYRAALASSAATSERDNT